MSSATSAAGHLCISRSQSCSRTLKRPQISTHATSITPAPSTYRPRPVFFCSCLSEQRFTKEMGVGEEQACDVPGGEIYTRAKTNWDREHETEWGNDDHRASTLVVLRSVDGELRSYQRSPSGVFSKIVDSYRKIFVDDKGEGGKYMAHADDTPRPCPSPNPSRKRIIAS